jgi:hypothetical protein
MTTATKTKPAAKTPFINRLRSTGNATLSEALVQYRGLVTALADDPCYETDEESVFELLGTLRLTADDLQADVQALLQLKLDEQQLAELKATDWNAKYMAAGKAAKEAQAEALRQTGLQADAQAKMASRSHLDNHTSTARKRLWRLFDEPNEAMGKILNPAKKPVLLPDFVLPAGAFDLDALRQKVER